MKTIISNICTAFEPKTVGSKVTDPQGLQQVISDRLDEVDLSKNFVSLPAIAKEMVSVGVAKRTTNPDDYVVRVWRGVATLFLKRTDTMPQPDGVAAIVYSRKKYLEDPDVMKSPPEMGRITASNAEAIIVAVLAFHGPKSPVSPARFVANLAGANNDYKTMTKEELVTLAQEVTVYDAEWCVVAD